MSMIQDFFRRFTRVFHTETLTIDELRELNLYNKVQRQNLVLQNEYDELLKDYNDLKQVLFSPLYTPDVADKGQMLTYILIGITAINLLLTYFKK